MIGVPMLFPDEHIYSGLIRARYKSGQMYINTQRFFELNRLPYHKLRSQVPLCENLTKIIENMNASFHEQFHIRLAHSPFAPWLLGLEDSENPIELRISGYRKNLEENPFKTNRNWKFCKTCAEEDKDKYGTSIWHASHQGLGVLVCSKHKENLYSHSRVALPRFLASAPLAGQSK